MIRRPPRSTPLYSSAASDVYKRQIQGLAQEGGTVNNKILSSPFYFHQPVELWAASLISNTSIATSAMCFAHRARRPYMMPSHPDCTTSAFVSIHRQTSQP